MNRKIKALGLAFVATVALSAVVASAAQAGTLDIEVDPAIITGESEGQQELAVQIQTPKTGNNINGNCKKASFEGTVEQDGVGSQETHEATVTPTYQECTFAGLAAQVRMNGCKYTLTGAGHASKTFTVDIVGCTAGKQMTLQTAVCQIEIPAQNGLSHAVGTNIQTVGRPLPPHEVTLSVTIPHITHTQTGFGCPDGNNHHGVSLALNGNTIVKAYYDLAIFQVTEHGHQFTENFDGAQVKITST